MNERIKEFAEQAGFAVYGWNENEFKKFAELVRADERNFIAAKWETWYGYDKHGVAEFIRKRANTQGEQHDRQF